MGLPTFLIIGAHKSGTTALYHFLKQHPQIFMSPEKEPRFFALKDDSLDYRGPRDPAAKCDYTTLENYRRLFDGAVGYEATGEASTLYLYSKKAVKNIEEYLPGAKMIVLLRNPIERAYSNYIYARQQNREPLDSFGKALQAEEDRIENQWGPLWHYTKKGFYYKQLSRYYDAFSPDQIMVVLQEELKKETQKVLETIFTFLEVDNDYRPNISKKHNVSGLPKSTLLNKFLGQRFVIKDVLKQLVPQSLALKIKNTINSYNLDDAPAMNPEVRMHLQQLYQNDIQHLEKLINRDLSHWLK